MPLLFFMCKLVNRKAAHCTAGHAIHFQKGHVTLCCTALRSLKKKKKKKKLPLSHILILLFIRFLDGCCVTSENIQNDKNFPHQKGGRAGEAEAERRAWGEQWSHRFTPDSGPTHTLTLYAIINWSANFLCFYWLPYKKVLHSEIWRSCAACCWAPFF